MIKQINLLKSSLGRNYSITAGILSLLFILFTKIIPYILISRKILYDKEGILMKAAEFAKVLTWPLSIMFPKNFVSSYYFLPIVFLYYLILVIAIGSIHDYLRKRKYYRWIFLTILIAFTLLRLYPNTLVFLDNNQPSKVIGTPGDGSLYNGKRLLFEGSNFEYFNFLSYLKGYCFVHEKVKTTIIGAYKTCEVTCPGIKFYTGEGSKKNGGPYVFNHRTHQNGTSIDLMLVFKKENKQFDPLGLFNAYGYGIETDENGIINKCKPINSYPKNVSIDFETNAKFLLALDDACKKNGIRIKIVILKVELKSLLFATPSGKKLLTRNLRFAYALPKLVNDAHDDHFHVDFYID